MPLIEHTISDATTRVHDSRISYYDSLGDILYSDGFSHNGFHELPYDPQATASLNKHRDDIEHLMGDGCLGTR